MKACRVSLFVACWLALASPGRTQDTQPLTLARAVALPNVKGRIDHLSVDLKGQRLFVAAVDNHTLEVIDLKSGRQVRTISGLAEPQGVFYDAATNRMFVATGLDGRVTVFDAATFKVLTVTKYPDDADNLRYDARTHGLIVGYAGAKQLRNRAAGTGGLGLMDAAGKRTGEVVIDAHPESFRLEQSGSRLFVNVPERNEIEVVDPARRTVLARWPVTSARSNFPMTLDEAHHRLIVGTWTPPSIVVFDTETGKEVASAPIAGSSDDLFYDARRGRIYVLTSAGALDVFRQRDPDHYERIARYPTPPHTQTGLFVPELNQLFAAVQRQGAKSAEIRVYQAN